MQSNGKSDLKLASEGSAWHLARTKPQSEYVAAAALERNGYDLYFPRVQTPRPRLGYKDIPLFPGYLFVRRDQDASRLPPINHVAGMIGWVQFDGVAPKVPDEVVAELVRRLATIKSEGGYWRRFRRGEKVVVTAGSMENLAEVLEEPKSPQSQVRVLLDFMGQLVPARVPWEDLQPASDDPVAFYPGRAPRRTRGRGRWIRGFGPRAAARM